MRQITKLLLRIIMLQIRSKTKPEIAEEQCGFMEGKGTTNAIYFYEQLQRAFEIQQDMYICFIDYTKTCDTIKHEQLMKILHALNVDERDLRIIHKLYWEQTTAITYKNKLGDFVKIKRGVQQGCVLSPDLFSLYSEYITREMEGYPGITIGGPNIHNLWYADDTALIATSEKDLKTLLDIITEESERVRLSFNIKKTVTMLISKKNVKPVCNITVNNSLLQQVGNSDGISLQGIKTRIGQAKKAFMNL